MKKLITFSILFLTIHATIQPAVTAPTPTTATTKPFTAYDIHIINTSNTAATLQSITAQYSTTTIHQVTAKTAVEIPANKGVAFGSTINIPGATFQGITQLIINSNILNFPADKAYMGTSPLYITNVGGIWKLTTKPTPKAKATPKIAPAPKATPVAPTVPAQPKINSTQAAAVPYLKTTRPDLPIMPKAPVMKSAKMPRVQPKAPMPIAAKAPMPAGVPPMPVAPKIMQSTATPKTSMAAKASAKAIDQTMAKTVA